VLVEAVDVLVQQRADDHLKVRERQVEHGTDDDADPQLLEPLHVGEVDAPDEVGDAPQRQLLHDVRSAVVEAQLIHHAGDERRQAPPEHGQVPDTGAELRDGLEIEQHRAQQHAERRRGDLGQVGDAGELDREHRQEQPSAHVGEDDGPPRLHHRENQECERHPGVEGYFGEGEHGLATGIRHKYFTTEDTESTEKETRSGEEEFSIGIQVV
jgi:hypothetical protein